MVKLFFKTKFFLLQEQLKTILIYYKNLHFALYDLTLGFCSLFFNPYRTCRKFLQKQGIKIIDGYGETPLSTFSKMAQAAEISSKDHYIELGSGRGKTCIWAALFLGCSVTGYEWVPLFADLSKALCRLLRLPAQFEQVSLFKADLSQATVVYLYSTQLSDEELLKIPLATLPSGARLITISAPHPDFSVTQTIPVTFPWGDTIAYIHKK